MVRVEKHLITTAFSAHELSSGPVKKIEMLRSSNEIFAKMLSLIATAKYSIDLQYYSYETDGNGIGKKILDACQLAKKRNPHLKIRVLLDNSVEYLHNGERVGKSDDARKRRDETNEILMQLRDEGILEDVKITNHFDLKNKFTNSLRLFSNILHRDHKKLFLVDARDPDTHPDAVPKAIVASTNVNSHHERDWKDAGRYFEGGDIVKALAEDFEDTEKHAKKWNRVYEVQNLSEYWQKYRRDIIRHLPFSIPQVVGDAIGSVVRNAERRGYRKVIVPDFLGRKERDWVVATDSFWPRIFGSDILGAHDATAETYMALKKAKPGDIVPIATPYPGFFTLTNRLTRASKKGVDVRLIIPKENNHALYNHKKIEAFEMSDRIPQWLQRFIRAAAHTNLDYWEKRLSRGGIPIYKYTGKREGLMDMLHFKGGMVIRKDGTTRSFNGSANYTKGPISGLNREIIVATEGTVATDPMLPFMQELMADSEYIPPTKVYRRRSSVK